MIPHWLMQVSPIKEALARAETAVLTWCPNGGADERAAVKEAVLGGWSGWSLEEAIAIQILEAQGYDTESLEELSEHDVVDGWTMPRMQETSP